MDKPALTDYSDQRQTIRIAASWRVQVMLPSHQIVTGRVVDISLGGVGLLLPDCLPNGVVVAVALHIPAPEGGYAPSKIMQTACKVVHQVISRSGAKVGMQFTHIDKETRGLIETWTIKLSKPIRKLPPGM